MSESKTYSRSEALFAQAQKHIPGGVNSPVRAFKGVGGNPVFFSRGEGAYIYDEDNNAYVDYIGAWGPLILGHCHPKVINALKEQIELGLAFGAPTAKEIEMAELICQLMPSIESVRLVNSGTEATMSVIRLARGVTKRDKVVKFEGCYHGHVDSLLVKAGSGALTMGSPDSAGIPESIAQLTYILPYNNSQKVEELFKQHGHEIACIIVEPVAGNMNCVPPLPGFLESLREITSTYGSLLIFDEVMTGFRVALGGAQSIYNIDPDMTALGKIIGGGMPIGAFGGKKEYMDLLTPLGPVYQAGTLSGNPLAVSAGLVMLQEISQPDFYEKLAKQTSLLLQGLQERADAAGIPFSTNQVGGMFGCFFSEDSKILTYEQVMQCNVERFKQYFHSMLDQGIYLAPSAFEAGFLSSSHNEKEIQLTLDAAAVAFLKLSQ